MAAFIKMKLVDATLLGHLAIAKDAAGTKETEKKREGLGKKRSEQHGSERAHGTLSVHELRRHRCARGGGFHSSR